MIDCDNEDTQIFAFRILDSTEVHILPTANPDGWNRAEEGLCSGQVSSVMCFVSCVMCLVSCVMC